MITEKDIENIKNELGEEKFNKFVNLITEKRLDELKEIARNKVKIKFVRVLKASNSKLIQKLIHNEKIRKETINLLNQTNMSLKNVHRLIKNNSIVDANTILRSCFENLIMGMMIYYDENVYKEFIDLRIDDKTRKLTKPQKLRNDFRKILRLLDVDWFNDISNAQLKDMLDEFYDKLCFFTHSTLIVNAMVELSKENHTSLYIFALKQNAYFLELLLYLCLKYLNNSTNEPIDVNYIIVGWFVIMSDIKKEDTTNESIDRIKELLYIDINKDYLDKNKDLVEIVTGDLKQLQQSINKNPILLLNILKELIK